MKYKEPSIPTKKNVLKKNNHLLIRNLKLGDKKQELIYPPSILPRVVKQYHAISYEKESTFIGPKLPDQNPRIDIITKNGEYDSFIWHTTVARIKEATRWGIVRTQSVTGQAISALGQYRLIVLDRIQQGVISNRHYLKAHLIDHYQDRLEALQELESLTNSGGNRKDFERVFNRYKAALKKIKADLLSNAAFAQDFAEVDPTCINRMLAAIDADIVRADDFISRYDFSASNNATGIHSILTFVKTTMLTNLREMQNHNQNITYSRKLFYAATRGDLNSCIEDAVKVIRDYNAPPRDTIDSDHHGWYGRNGHDPIAYDSSFHCASSFQEHRAMLAATFIEGMNTLDMSDRDHPIIRTIDKVESKLKIVRATKWETGGGITVAVKRLGAWFANVVIKLSMGIIELPLTLLVEPLTFGHALPFFQTVRKLATFEIKVERAGTASENSATSFEINLDNPAAPKLAGENLLKHARHSRQSLGLRVRELFAIAFKNTFQDLMYGMRDVYQQFAIHLFDEIENDYNDGKDVPNFSNVIHTCNEQLVNIAAQEIHIRGKLFTNDAADFIPIEGQFASPLYIPNAGEYDDILNASAEGLDKFMEFFLHNIHAKHPFAGTIFTLTYIAGGLAVIAPAYVAFLGPKYISIMQTMGASMAKGPLAEAVSAGATQAQVASSFFEMLIHGHKSWFAKCMVEFEKDPFTSLIYAATAVGLGYVVVYQLHIPSLSEMLIDEMGSFPPTSLGFMGVKLGFAVYELLNEHGELDLEKAKTDKKLREYLAEVYTETHPEADAQQIQEKVDTILDELLTAENVEKLKTAYNELQNKDHFAALSNNHQLNQVLARHHLIQFLTSNTEHLPYLSAEKKHQLAQQLKLYFPADEARSLKKLIYPEESKSILRTTLAIILAYPAFLVRLGAASVSSLMHGNTKPLQSAGHDFGFKLLKDLTRVGRACGKIIKTTYTFFHRHGKTFGDVIVNTILARTESLVANSHHVAEIGYQISGKVDVMCEQARQLTPIDDPIKTVTAATPGTANSYIRMFRTLDNLPGLKASVSDKEDSQIADHKQPERLQEGIDVDMGFIPGCSIGFSPQ